MADALKLTATGQALQSALDLVGHGGDRTEIVSQIYGQAVTANQQGNADLANELMAIAVNYRDAPNYGSSTTQGLAYLMNLQRDITAGKYSEPAPPPDVTTMPVAAPTAPQNPVNIAQNRLAEAVQGGNPAVIQKAEQDLERARADFVAAHSDTTAQAATTTTSPSALRPVTAPRAPAASAPRATSGVVRSDWPPLATLTAFRDTLESLNGAVLTPDTSVIERMLDQRDRQLLRTIRAR